MVELSLAGIGKRVALLIDWQLWHIDAAPANSPLLALH